MEYLDIVDENGEPTGKTVEREYAHANGIRHRTSHVWILRERNGHIQILLQKRSENKDSYPGDYDISSAGHIPAGSGYIESALRELKEELGVETHAERLIYCGQRRFTFNDVFHGKDFHDNQVSNVYVLWLDRDENEFRIQKEEISEVKWFNLTDFRKDAEMNRIPNCIFIEELDMIEKSFRLEHEQTCPINGIVIVPGSKSVTNRAMLLASLASGRSVLHGVQFSDDSRHFLTSLETLGFELSSDEVKKCVTIMGCGGTIPKKQAVIDAGSAGTAARFLTAMLGFSDGTYEIKCSEQMKKRPMRPLFDALTGAGAEIEFTEKEGYLPVKIKGNSGNCERISMDISSSTQFLSAILLTSSMLKNGVDIDIISDKKDGSYIRITRKMLSEWGIEVILDKSTYRVSAGQKPAAREYEIEPDVSGACYFYAAAAMTGGSMTVKGVHEGLMQGDMKFIGLLEKMGCHKTETESGIRIDAGETGYSGIDVDMNDYSDQALTLAAMAPFASSPVTIRNIAHIRMQECDRLRAMEENLNRIGIRTHTDNDSITIFPGTPHGACIETYKDHRVAMAFSLIGLKVPGIVILDPGCTAKTFENYFDVLDSVCDLP